MPKQLTGPQVITGWVGTDKKLPKTTPVSYDTYRKIRKDPTISLVRSVVMMPIVKLPWSYEKTKDAPEGAQEFISDHMDRIKAHVVRTGLEGGIDFGWQPYEKVFKTNREGMLCMKLKPLLQDITEILVYEDTGAFFGFEQQNYQGTPVTLDLKKSLLLSFNVEGTDWYGQSTLEIARGPYDWWNTANDAAERYDRKIAGSHWKIEYPPGETNVDGVMKPNNEVAKIILSSLQSSGAVIIPAHLAEYVADLNASQQEAAWKIELMSDSGAASASFDTRLRYCDSLKARAFGVPERSTLEGQFGTKAEAGEHADLAFTLMEQRGGHIVAELNAHVVNHLLRVNYGEEYENTVYIVQGSLQDTSLTFLRQVYMSILANPNTFLDEFGEIDTRALKEQLDIPLNEEEEDALFNPNPIVPDPTTVPSTDQPAGPSQ